jgi:hypothetical protein
MEMGLSCRSATLVDVKVGLFASVVLEGIPERYTTDCYRHHEPLGRASHRWCLFEGVIDAGGAVPLDLVLAWSGTFCKHVLTVFLLVPLLRWTQGPSFTMPAIVEPKTENVDDPIKSSDLVGGEKQSQSSMPVPINATNRPPSTTTVSSTTSTGAQRTTTSRRGGRTRSRSPAVMGNRLPGPIESMPPVAGGDNPSSAAAAAAAAAKAFSSSAVGRNPNTWSEAGAREDPAFHPGYDKPYSGSSNWPGEEGHGAHAYGPAHRYQGGTYRDEYQQQEGGGHYRRPDEAAAYHDRRYRETARGPAYDEERGPPPPHGGHYPPDFRYGQNRDMRNSPKGQRAGGGTSLVIGTSKPIHVPKTPSGPPQRKSRGGSTLASVFRGRPGSDSDRAAAPNEDEDSPQKILLSLRTPTTSFEDTRGPERGKKTSGLPLSPDDPPRIQNSHHQRPTEQLFEVSYCAERFSELTLYYLCLPCVFFIAAAEKL